MCKLCLTNHLWKPISRSWIKDSAGRGCWVDRGPELRPQNPPKNWCGHPFTGHLSPSEDRDRRSPGAYWSSTKFWVQWEIVSQGETAEDNRAGVSFSGILHSVNDSWGVPRHGIWRYSGATVNSTVLHSLACASGFEERVPFLRNTRYSRKKAYKTGACLIMIQWPEAREAWGWELEMKQGWSDGGNH